jgi:hypothetical protein
VIRMYGIVCVCVRARARETSFPVWPPRPPPPVVRGARAAAGLCIGYPQDSERLQICKLLASRSCEHLSGRFGPHGHPETSDLLAVLDVLHAGCK